jgi:Flp pilus assembly protein TadG
MSIQLLVILVPVIFGLMGFAIDLGRLYLIRGELHQAANAMALAAAGQMAGQTATALDNMTNAANLAINENNGNRFNFGGTVISPGAATITCFSTLADASTNNQGTTTDCGSPPPLFVQASISVPAPLLFWSLLPGGETRTTTVASYAVAGMSAPLCTGCGVVPFAVQALDATGADQVEWGFVPGSLYTFYYSCTGTPPQAVGGVGAVAYVILNRVDPNLDESDQMFRHGAQGLSGSTITTPNVCTSVPTTPTSCVNIGDIESIPANAIPAACTAATPAIDVTNALCGLSLRLTADVVGTCQTNVTDFGAISPIYAQDTDLTYLTDPTAYAGNGRRIITVPLVNGLANDTTCNQGMTVVAFRQFLLEPNADGSAFSPLDQNGRFVAMYLGSVAPVSQGWFDTRYAPACRSWLTTGPGKVVLHQ